jgi:hypothetical protein
MGRCNTRKDIVQLRLAGAREVGHLLPRKQPESERKGRIASMHYG